MLGLTSKPSHFFYTFYKYTGYFIIYLVAAFAPNIGNALKKSWTPKEEALLEQYSTLMSLGLDKAIKDRMMFPELIICGGQSSGKTSTLNRLLGIQLPVSAKTTTTVPTCIHTRKGDRDGTHAEVTFCGKEYTVAESGLSRLISSLQDSLKTSMYDKGFSTEQLNIVLTRENCLPLSILDLPGRIRGGDRLGIQKLNEIYEKYLTQDGIVLFVTKGDDDTSDTFELFHSCSTSDGTPSFSTLATSDNKAFFPKGLLVFTSAASPEYLPFYLADRCSVIDKFNDSYYNQVGLGIYLVENYGIRSTKPDQDLLDLGEEAAPRGRYSVLGHLLAKPKDPSYDVQSDSISTCSDSTLSDSTLSESGYRSTSYHAGTNRSTSYHAGTNRSTSSHAGTIGIYSEEEEMNAFIEVYPKNIHPLCGIKNLRDKIKDTVIAYLSDETMIANATDILHDYLNKEKESLNLLTSENNQGKESFRKALRVLTDSVKSLFSVDSTSGSLEVASSFKANMKNLEYLILVKCFSAIDGFQISLAWENMAEFGKDYSDEQAEEIIKLYTDQCQKMEKAFLACYSKEYSYTNLEALYVRYSEDFFRELEDNMNSFIEEVTGMIQTAIIDMAKDNKYTTGLISRAFFLSEAGGKAKDVVCRLKDNLLTVTSNAIESYKFAACKTMETKNIYLKGFNAIYNIQQHSTPDGFVEKFKTYMVSHKNRAKVLAGGASVVVGGMAALSLATSTIPAIIPIGLVGGAIAAHSGALPSPSVPVKGLKRFLARFKQIFSRAKEKDNELKNTANGDFVITDALEAVNLNQDAGIAIETLTKERWQRIFEGLNENPDQESSARKTAILEALSMISSHHAQVVESVLNQCLLCIRSSMSSNNPNAFIHDIAIQGFSDFDDFLDHKCLEENKNKRRLLEMRIHTLDNACNVISNIKKLN